MRLVDIRREAGLSHVSNTPVWKALRSHGIKAYKELFKLILKVENKVIREYSLERMDSGVTILLLGGYTTGNDSGSL